MQGELIPDADHVARYCKPQSIAPSTGKPTGESFKLRNGQNPEIYASVNWLELLARSSRGKEIEELRRIFAQKPFKLSTKGLFAVLNVGNTKKYVLKESPDSRRLRFIHEPEFDDPSHSGMHGYAHEDNLIAELIAETVIETQAAKPEKS